MLHVYELTVKDLRKVFPPITLLTVCASSLKRAESIARASDFDVYEGRRVGAGVTPKLGGRAS